MRDLSKKELEQIEGGSLIVTVGMIVDALLGGFTIWA